MAFPSTARASLAPNVVASSADKLAALRQRLSQGTVEWSADAERIFALPRRPPPNLDGVVEEMTARLRRPGGTQVLRPHQAWPLWEGPQARGLYGNLALGAGKTILGLLMPMVWPGCTRAMLLIPPKLKVQLLEHDWDFYGAHWKLPNLAGDKRRFIDGRPVLHVVTYSELSGTGSSTLMDQIRPELVMGDEIHRLARFTAARTKRFFRYLTAHPEVPLCGWSGTPITDSVRQVAYLMAGMLGNGSPVPYDKKALDQWAAALDPGQSFVDPGVLQQLCKPGESVRSGFRRRCIDTLGVVATAEDQLGTELTFYERAAPALPPEVRRALSGVRAGDPPRRPDGDPLLTPLDEARCLRQLATGFYLRWKFPHGEPRELIDEWFLKRQIWGRELREKLKCSQEHLDSPKLCSNAAERFYVGGCPVCERGPRQEHAPRCRAAKDHPLWEAFSWPLWRDIKDSVYHETEAQWVSDFLLKDAAVWAGEEPGIVWVEHVEFGHALARLTKLPYYGEGENASRGIAAENGKRSVILSINANNEGLNLQDRFYRNLFVTFPSNAKIVGQAVGRTHRPGQVKDEVEIDYYAHTGELADGIATARQAAVFSTEVGGSEHKLVAGTWAKPGVAR